MWIWNIIFNFLFLRFVMKNLIQKKFLNCLESELAEEFLHLLLKLMSLSFYLKKDFRRNLENFQGRYLFKSRDESITVAAIFKNKKLKVKEKKIDNTDVTVIFKDQKALMKFLLSSKPDILNSLLKQEVIFDGNLNYLLKFIFMSKHLQLMATGKL